MKAKFYLLFLLIPLFVACDEPADRSVQPSKKPIAAGEVGSTLPNFVTKDFNGRSLDSKNFKGTVVIIDFWATWCAPCRQEMPGYQALVDKYGAQGLAVIGFKADVMEDTEDPSQFLRETGIHYPIAVGSEEIRKKFGGLKGLPTTYIYDRDGILRNKIIGFEYTSTIEKIVQTML
jgi:thiol-disulfide isomerase/thioredoxin